MTTQNELTLTIPGNVPSQKNGKMISFNRRTGQRFVRSNDRVLEWKAFAVKVLEDQFKGYMVTEYPLIVMLVFFFDNKRRHDLDNAAAGVMDALRDAGVIVDDNVNYVNVLSLHYGGLDKENPRVDIYLGTNI
jgi:Holliday junction resolvase RusA-like endonuclease